MIPPTAAAFRPPRCMFVRRHTPDKAYASLSSAVAGPRTTAETVTFGTAIPHPSVVGPPSASGRTTVSGPSEPPVVSFGCPCLGFVYKRFQKRVDTNTNLCYSATINLCSGNR